MNTLKIKSIKWIAPPLLITAALIGVSACSQKSNERTEDSTNAALKNTSDEIKSDATKVGVYLDDAAVTAAVNASLMAEPGLNAFSINVTTNNGVTTIKGFVDSQGNKEKVGAVVAVIDGVKQFNNELVVKPN